MGMEERSNYLTQYAKYQFRKIKFFPLLIVVFVIFLLTIPYYINDYKYNNISVDDDYDYTLPNNPVQNLTCPHYKMALFIFSEMKDVDKRMLMREELFGMTDNLIPCMKQDTTEIYYKFFVRNGKNNQRTFRSEQMEYNDIVEIDAQRHPSDWHRSLLEHAQLLQEICTTFDHLIITDVYTMVNLERIQNTISSSVIANQTISDTRKIVWGSFNSNRTENMAVILGSSAIQSILNNPEDYKLNYTSIISSLYLYHYHHPDKKISDDLIFINDPISIIEWPNSIRSIACMNCVVAIGHIYQDWEIRKIKNYLNISTTLPCNARLDLKMYSKETTSKLRPNIAIVTSSFLYNDNCMMEVAPLSAQNKREYAERHGYAFVPRSTEYAQQSLRGRKVVWGKIDVIEKVLSYYEWLLWLDMDAFFANRTLSVEHLLEMCEERVGGKDEFKKIDFIVARPIGDQMINAGVFLIRNTDWSRNFIRTGVQSRYDRATSGMKEQQAMRDAILKPMWKSNVLYLDGDDHTINTFPDRYRRGDFIIHYAPEEGCPAAPVLKGLSKVKILEEFPDAEISMPF